MSQTLPTETLDPKLFSNLDATLDFLFSQDNCILESVANESNTSPESDNSSSMTSFFQEASLPEMSPDTWAFDLGNLDSLAYMDLPIIEDADINSSYLTQLSISDLLELDKPKTFEANHVPDDVVHLDQEIIEAPEHIVETSSGSTSGSPHSMQHQSSGEFTINFEESFVSNESPAESHTNVGPIRNGRRSKQRNRSSLPYTVHDVEPESLALNNEDLVSGQPGEPIRLTAEESQYFLDEGMDVPTHLPLTKKEERVLKTVRRMIRNRYSAKASRAKKQGYVEGLEKRVALCTQENSQLKKQMKRMEEEKGTWMKQLNTLRSLVRRYMPSDEQLRNPIAGTSLFAMMLTFAVVLNPDLLPNLWKPGGEAGKIALPSVLPGRNRVLLEEKARAMELPEPYSITIRPGPPWENPPKTRAVVLPKSAHSIPKYASTGTHEDIPDSPLQKAIPDEAINLTGTGSEMSNLESSSFGGKDGAVEMDSGGAWNEHDGRTSQQQYMI